MSKTVRITIAGRVQGVFFRAYTVQRARALKIKGYCKNLPDGRVEVCADGEEAAVQKLIDWCKQGPPLARVSSIQIDDLCDERTFGGFDVR